MRKAFVVLSLLATLYRTRSQLRFFREGKAQFVTVGIISADTGPAPTPALPASFFLDTLLYKSYNPYDLYKGVENVQYYC